MDDIKLQDSEFYNEVLNEQEYTEYRNSQITRHGIKHYKKRIDNEYKICFEQISEFVPTSSKMICLGTRNNHERDVFRKATSELNIDVFSQDIALASGADFIGDFNKLSDFVSHDWDVIYSNSIDHAINARNTFYEWLRVLKSGGIMVLGFSFTEGRLSESDCNSFTKEDIGEFMRNGESFEYLKDFKAVDYYYWAIRKK